MLKTLNPHSQAVCTQAWKYLGAAKSHGIETMKHCKGDESEQGALYPLAMAEIRSREYDMGHQRQLLKYSPIYRHISDLLQIWFQTTTTK